MTVAAREQRDALVLEHLPLARSLARRYARRADVDDLDQVASMALVKAADRFDPDRGLAFSSFAVPTILGELKRHFRDRGWMVRVPRDLQELSVRLVPLTESLTGALGRAPTPAELAQRAGTSVEQVLEARAATSAHFPDSLDRSVTEDGEELADVVGGRIDPGFERAENAAVVDRLLSALDDRQREILRLRFEEDLPQSEIGSLLGLSQTQVSRLIRASIGALQLQAASRG
ncbi:RNA polymerase sigma-B factor [Solirubrobacter pauli]|uniref:RNA polymerase sigma-B factor n=1 Tax=Solirubrobacter pauli TaxID=166793 RepID=A0A660L2S7_9ACTN|nr:sigma-70 family RNA polymerase sigma factor [Solirubrobacter pauli]RKQ88237.1 RNA polymerase sigma-B factor [Solirubrobacter pauli]